MSSPPLKVLSVSASSTGSGRAFSNCFLSSPAICKQSARLPPLPARNSVPPSASLSMTCALARAKELAQSDKFGNSSSILRIELSLIGEPTRDEKSGNFVLLDSWGFISIYNSPLGER